MHYLSLCCNSINIVSVLIIWAGVLFVFECMKGVWNIYITWIQEVLGVLCHNQWLQQLEGIDKEVKIKESLELLVRGYLKIVFLVDKK